MTMNDTMKLGGHYFKVSDIKDVQPGENLLGSVCIGIYLYKRRIRKYFRLFNLGGPDIILHGYTMYEFIKSFLQQGFRLETLPKYLQNSLSEKYLKNKLM